MIIMKAKILRQRFGWKNPGFHTRRGDLGRCGDLGPLYYIPGGDYRLHAGWPYFYMMIMKA